MVADNLKKAIFCQNLVETSELGGISTIKKRNNANSLSSLVTLCVMRRPGLRYGLQRLPLNSPKESTGVCYRL